jgi:2-polyprenyl-3-methyl-5-hydroxy-6-metoxy-1,4-benzoquinol methylase
MEDSYYSQPRAELLQFVPRGVQSILDIGCGSGGFGRSLVDHLGPLINLWGVEPSPQAAQQARSHYSTVLTGTLEGVATQIDRRFDLICCNDVIEHGTDPAAMLSLVQGLLTSTGSLLISVPNVRSISVLWMLLVRRDWQYQEHGVMDRTHLRFFTKRSVCRLVRQSGYSIDIVRHISPMLPTRLKYLRHLGRALPSTLHTQIVLVCRSERGLAESERVSLR